MLHRVLWLLDTILTCTPLHACTQKHHKQAHSSGHMYVLGHAVRCAGAIVQHRASPIIVFLVHVLTRALPSCLLCHQVCVLQPSWTWGTSPPRCLQQSHPYAGDALVKCSSWGLQVDDVLAPNVELRAVVFCDHVAPLAALPKL